MTFGRHDILGRHVCKRPKKPCLKSFGKSAVLFVKHQLCPKRTPPLPISFIHSLIHSFYEVSAFGLFRPNPGSWKENLSLWFLKSSAKKCQAVIPQKTLSLYRDFGHFQFLKRTLTRGFVRLLPNFRQVLAERKMALLNCRKYFLSLCEHASKGRIHTTWLFDWVRVGFFVFSFSH